MSDPKHTRPEGAEDKEREAALAAWERGDLAVGDAGPASERPVGVVDRLLHREPWRGAPADEDGYVAPPRRSAFPPSFLFVLAAALAALALEPSADLGYHLAGPSAPIDLGRPAAYDFAAAEDGALATIEGIASPKRGSYSQWGDEWEVFALVGAPVLVRREPGAKPPGENVAELVSLRGRLMKLEDAPSSFFERLFRPASRYTSLRLAFQARGELPLGRTIWLLLDDEVPRSNFSAILVPLLLWAGAGLVLFAAVRARLRRPAPRRPRVSRSS